MMRRRTVHVVWVGPTRTVIVTMTARHDETMHTYTFLRAVKGRLYLTLL